MQLSACSDYRGCSCGGCGALAAQGIRVAHAQTTSLLSRADKRKPRDREVIRSVGHALVRVLLARIRLLLATDVRASARRATLAQAQQCLAQWEKLIRWRFATQFEPADEVRHFQGPEISVKMGVVSEGLASSV